MLGGVGAGGAAPGGRDCANLGPVAGVGGSYQSGWRARGASERSR
jgi:hypothetical protein